jgi:hypothetical protein
MKRATLLVLISIAFTNFALVNANAGSQCNNGTMSSNSGRGTCSYNGGVNKNFPSYSDPGSSSYNRKNSYGSTLNNDPYGFDSYGSSKSKSYGSTLNNDPYSSSKSNSYGSTLNNDPYGFGSYGSSKSKPCYTLRC